MTDHRPAEAAREAAWETYDTEHPFRAQGLDRVIAKAAFMAGYEAASAELRGLKEAAREMVEALVAASPKIDGLIAMHHMRYSGSYDGDTSVYTRVYQARPALEALAGEEP